MQIGMIGLGKMGYSLSLNLLDKNYTVIAHDMNKEALQQFISDGGESVSTIKELVHRLEPPRTVWMMVPAGDATESVFQALLNCLESGDRLIDGGNAHYKDSIKRGGCM